MSTYTIVGGNTTGYGGQYAYCNNSTPSSFSLGSSPANSGMGRILWSGDKWVCIARNGLLYYSSGSSLPTSSSWTLCTNRPYTGLVNESAIIYATLPNNSSMYLWGGWHQDNPTGNAAIYYSTNGITWSPANSIKSIFGNCQGSGSGCVTAIGYNGTYFLAGCGQEYTGTTNLAYSADGINWSAVSCSTFSNANVRGTRISSILWTGSNWLIGTKWGQYESPQLSSLYISSGFSSPFSTIVLSAVSCQVNKEVHYMAINPAGMIVATGLAANTYNNIAYSSDSGLTWNAITTTPANTTMFSTMGENVIWNGTSWIASGSGSWPAYGGAMSSDGINWQGIEDVDARIGQADQTAIASSGYVIVPPPPPPAAPAAPTIGSISGTSVSFTNADSSVTNHQYSIDSGTTWATLSPAQASSPIDLSLLYLTLSPPLTAGSHTISLRAVNTIGNSSSVTATVIIPGYTAPAVTVSGEISAGALAPTVTTVTASSGTTLAASALLNNTTIQTVNLGAATNITTIPANTFQGCTALTSVTLPSSITTIDASAFSGCSALVTLVIPSTVTIIGASALAGTALTSITLSGTVTIGAYAFAGCTYMTSASI